MIQFIKLKNIIQPLLAVADVKSDMPFTYLFLKLPCLWRKELNGRMVELKINLSITDSEGTLAEGGVESAEEESE